MKTTRRSGISQSLDLFIIIAVVLAAGGIVAAAASGLIGAATSQSTLQATESTLVGGPAAVLTLQLKNVGTSTISVSSGSVTIAGITALTAAATCGAPTVSAGIWGAGTCAVAATTIPYTNTGAITLAPGGQLSFSATITGGAPQPIVSGTTYPVTYIFGSVSNTLKLTAQ
jgi:hypothetical protein